MTAPKLCGFDVNGWHDQVVRNWTSIPGEEDLLGENTQVSAGPLSGVVDVGDGSLHRWIGGPQADLAPHGLSGGWGVVGHPEKRVTVQKLLDSRHPEPDVLAAAFTGLAQGAAYNVVAIDETCSEGAREGLLTALQAAKFKTPLLVWRPVLAALHALSSGDISVGQRVGVICHFAQGISIQELEIVSDHTGICAPERMSAGKQVTCPLGYEALLTHSRRAALKGDPFGSRTEHRVRARSVGRAALGLPVNEELLRGAYSDWEILDLRSFDVTKCVTDLPMLQELSEFDVVLVESLSQGKVREALISWISGGFTGPIIGLNAHSVALGALEAAQRCVIGQPVYFDFLPKLSTIVFGQSGASSFDLIRPDETVRAGEIYRSPEPAQFAIPKGQTQISVYLNKEGQTRPRKAKISLDAPTPRQCKVELSVEQKPAAGRAKIRLEARELGQSFSIDWDGASPDERTWSEIIAELTPKTTIPNRLVLPCGMQAWAGDNSVEGLSYFIEAELMKSSVDWELLAGKMPQRPMGKGAISSDGDFPSELSRSARDRLALLNEKALDSLEAQLLGNGSYKQASALLKFLTWQFKNCPTAVIGLLVECVRNNSLDHPFVGHAGRWKLIYHGLGRVAQGKTNEQSAINALLSTDMTAWSWDRESACMSFLLSRSDTAPCVLVREDVTRLANRVVFELEQGRKKLNDAGTWTLDYAPFLVAGLLRWRLKKAGALVAETDPIAAKMRDAIETTEMALIHGRHMKTRLAAKREKFLPILKDLKAELSGQGKNPNILIDLFNASR